MKDTVRVKSQNSIRVIRLISNHWELWFMGQIWGASRNLTTVDDYCRSKRLEGRINFFFVMIINHDFPFFINLCTSSEIPNYSSIVCITDTVPWRRINIHSLVIPINNHMITFSRWTWSPFFCIPDCACYYFAKSTARNSIHNMLSLSDRFQIRWLLC